MFFSPRRNILRGRFIDGVWHCDCEPPRPADHFVTKKAGPNHGRWCKFFYSIRFFLTSLTVSLNEEVYTCHNSQAQGCKFFLWQDDAEVREKETVLANRRSEPETPKKSSSTSRSEGGVLTPTRTSVRAERHTTPKTDSQSFRHASQTGGLLTPDTGRAPPADVRNRGIAQTPTKIRRLVDTSSDEDTYSWDESMDMEVVDLTGASSSARSRQPVFTPIMTPNQAPRKAMNTSPNKRKRADSEDEPPPYSELDNPSSQSHISTSTVPFSSVEVSATPTPRRYRDVLSAEGSSDMSSLSSNVLLILDHHDVVVPTVARDKVAALLDQQYLKTQGIIRGRDISREALKKKDEEIKSLKERIESLESEREMDKIVRSCLKTGK